MQPMLGGALGGALGTPAVSHEVGNAREVGGGCVSVRVCVSA